LVLGTNGRGAMMRAHADGRLASRYDALLAANLNCEYPEDRHITLARFRGWVAWAATYGPDGRDAALAWLSSSILLIDRYCVGHVPEILDGHAPHHQRGCDAQAWGVSELLRVWKKVRVKSEPPPS
jgi:hypothetical protein